MKVGTLIEVIWNKVSGTNGKILVSNTGLVKSLLRDEKILKPQIDQKGYLRVSVTIKGEKKTFKVHRLVAEAFCLNKNELPQVNHIDGNKLNNNALNLEWVSNKENANHAIKVGLWDSVISGAKAENEKRKIPIIAKNLFTGEVIYFDYMRQAEIAIGTKHINAVIKGERSQAAGYTFQYA